MSYDAEAQIAREIMSFAMSDQLYRGSKPVMWSSVERTALAEAEVEYHEKTSTTIWVKFPVVRTLDGDLDGAGFVHTAPGHGADDYNTFVKNRAVFEACGTKQVPHTVGPDSAYYPDVPF